MTMAQNVVRLIPRIAPFEEAQEAFFSGHFTVCIGLLRGSHTPQASLLRARALLRLNRHTDACLELETNVPPLGDHSLSCEHQFLYGTALDRLGNFEAGSECHNNAQIYALSSANFELISEANYYRALSFFMSGHIDEAELVLQESLDDRAGSSHARSLELLGLLAGLRCDIDRQVLMYRSSLDHLQKFNQHRDLFLEANVLNNLSAPVCESYKHAHNAAYIRERFNEFPWNEDLSPLRFDVVQHLAWLDALVGDHLSAFRHFRMAIDLAPSPARRSEALVSRSYLAREVSEPFSAAECIAEAQELTDVIDWDSTTSDERLALLNLAVLIAPSDPSKAAGYIERYRKLVTPMNLLEAPAHGYPLYRAKESHAFGLVALSQHGVSFALPWLEEAYLLFRSSSSTWRAALVAMDMYDITKDRKLLGYARQIAMNVPHSWLARRVAAAHTS